MRFINFERTKLPEEILKHNLEEKRKYFSDIHLDVEKSDAEVQVRLSLFLPFCGVLSAVHAFWASGTLFALGCSKKGFAFFSSTLLCFSYL